MRECAVEAGIKSTNLLIALEPETASIYCKHFIMMQEKEHRGEAKLISAFQPGARYLVLDAGGGTIDIIVHEVKSDGSLDEIYAANGGNWGGRMVDKAFLALLANVFGETVMQKFKEDCLADYFDLGREIEIKKRNAKIGSNVKIQFVCPCSLIEMYTDLTNENISDKINKNHCFEGKMKYIRGKLMIESGFCASLFETAIEAIIAHLKRILNDRSTIGTETILMVGGFSESSLLFNAVEAALPDKKVVLPYVKGVLKGAVIYGHYS